MTSDDWLWDAATGNQMLLWGAWKAGWFSLDYRTDTRGPWAGADEGLDIVTYRDPTEPTLPRPWIPRIWRAVDLPELAAESRD